MSRTMKVEQDGPDFYVIDSDGEVAEFVTVPEEYDIGGDYDLAGAELARCWFIEVAAPQLGINPQFEESTT